MRSGSDICSASVSTSATLSNRASQRTLAIVGGSMRSCRAST